MALEAGIARTLINPPLDIPSGMWVAQKHVRGEGLDMDLSATALVLADGDLKVAILDFDLCFLSDAQAAAIQSAVSAATGIPAANVFPFCSHTHAGPVTMEFYRGEGEDRVRAYIETIPHLAAGAARQAAQSLKPARAKAGVGTSDIGMNRDVTLDDGRIIVGCNPEGFADTSVGVLRIDSTDGQPLACIVNYACHPTVLGPGNRLISPDYPGSVRSTVEKNTGATCVFLQGAAGDMGPVETFVPDAAVARNLGTRLGLEAARVFLGLETRAVRKQLRGVIASGGALADYEHVPVDAPAPSLGLAARSVDLPTRSPFADVYEKAPEMLVEAERNLTALQSSGADAPTVAAALQRVVRITLRADRMNRYRGKKTLPVDSVALRIGDTAIVAIGGEPYSRTGVEVKAASPFPGQTLFAGYLGGDMMYIPTPDAFDPPFSSMQVDNSPYTREAAEIAKNHLMGLLQQVHEYRSAASGRAT
jgi:neutral ceramidase